MVLCYPSIKYTLLDIFMCSRNILRCDNMDIYIYIARSERIFGNTGK
jgi:putative heme iron utilization protein